MKEAKKDSIDVTSYDKYNYDYRQYWQNRSYEHAAESYALKGLLRKTEGKRFLDVGGSFGRNLPLYANKFDEVVIIDYSLNTLLKYEKEILSRFPNAKLVAGNIYRMPFTKGSFDGALMVRVLHHIAQPEVYFEQLASILKADAIYIQEFANKIHIKAIFKWLIKKDFEKFSLAPYQQPTTEEKQGSEDNGIFYNFHPKHIRKLLEESGLKVVKHTNCSYLRIPFLKRAFGDSLLLLFEKLLQFALSWSYITPSVIYKTIKSEGKSDSTSKNFREILACPKCKKQLKIDLNVAKCPECNSIYKKYSTVWDLRS